MRTALALLWLTCVGSTALAQAPLLYTAGKPADGVQAAAGAPAVKRGRQAHHRAAPVRSDKLGGSADNLSSCIGMWEPATHMTRRQWARACQRVAERLKSTTLQ